MNTKDIINTARTLVAGDKGLYLKQQLRGKLIEYKQYIDKYGQDMPEIRNWKWSLGETQKRKPLAKKTRVNYTDGG